MVFKCAVCNQKFESYEEIKNHQKIYSKSKDNLVCRICNGIYGDVQSLEIHQRVCTTVMYCRYCGKKFRDEAQLQFHLNSKKDCVPSAHVFCKDCGKRFKESAQLYFHLNFTNCKNIDKKKVYIHKRVCTKDILCKNCGKKFRDKTQLQYHLNFNPECKSKNPSLQCDKCSERFLTTNLLWRHQHNQHLKKY